MPVVGVMRWDTESTSAVMDEQDLAIVPRVGDLLQVRTGSGGQVSMFRVFEVVIHPTREDDLAADVHVEQVDREGTAAGAYIAERKRERGARP